eukprot:g33023.t1
MHTKKKKLEKPGITTSNNLVSPGTTVESGTTTGKSIINLSDHTLQPDEFKVLSFCAITKMDLIGLTAVTEEFIRRTKLREFFQDVSSEPNETTSKLDQLTERSMGGRAKKESNWIPLEDHCSGLDRYAQEIRECVNDRFISHTHKVVTSPRHNTMPPGTLKTNCNIVIKPADKGVAIITQNRMNYCKEVYQQLNDQEHNRQLPADPSKERSRQLNRVVKTFDPKWSKMDTTITRRNTTQHVHANTHVTRPTLSTSDAADKKAPRH